MKKKLASAFFVAILAAANGGCVKSMILNSTIASTRVGAGAADSIGDYELARSAASAGLLQFEGMHRLAPDNEDALFLLMKGWAGYGYAFASDDFEAAELVEDTVAAAYHQKRAKLAFDRSIAYGAELMSKEAEGFDAAADKDADTIQAWLKRHFVERDDAPVLFWTGSAWLARVNLLKDQRHYVAKLFVGVALVERSRELDPAYLSWGANSILASYHARTPMAELDLAKKLLDEALAKTARKSLGVQLNYAKYACAKNDQALYEKMLNEIVTTDDPDPELRLQNTVAKRRALRALSKAAIEECGFRLPAAPAVAPPPVNSATPQKPANSVN